MSAFEHAKIRWETWFNKSVIKAASLHTTYNSMFTDFVPLTHTILSQRNAQGKWEIYKLHVSEN